MREQPQDQHQNNHIPDIMQLCAQYADRLHYHKADDHLPEHWKTEDGDILWLHSSLSKNINETTFSVKLASASEVINNPYICQGAIAFSHQIEHYQQQLTKRSTESLDEESIWWAPSISNKAQKKDLLFGQALETFLENLSQNRETSLTFTEKLKQCIFTLCLAIEEDTITLKESRLLFPSSAIQIFKLCFNRMMKRRIHLLNHAMASISETTIGYIPLGLETDCTPKRVSHKLSLLNEIETQNLHALIEQDIEKFAQQVNATPHHITRLMQPLLKTTALWQTLWPGKEEMIYKHVMIQLQALRLHQNFENYQPRVEGILRKAEKLLKSITVK